MTQEIIDAEMWCAIADGGKRKYERMCERMKIGCGDMGKSLAISINTPYL